MQKISKYIKANKSTRVFYYFLFFHFSILYSYEQPEPRLNPEYFFLA
jgi:hypothetical protein